MVVTNNTRRRRQLLSSVSSAATASLWKHGGKQLLSGGGGIIKRRKISPLKNKNKLFTSTIRLQVVRTTATAATAAAATMDPGTQASTTLKSPSSTNNVSIKKFFRRYRRRGSSHGCSKNSSNTCCDADQHVEDNKKRNKSGNGSSKKKKRGTKEDANNKVETENVRTSLKERGSNVGDNNNDGMNDDDDDNDCNTTFAGGDDDTITTSTTISPMRNSHHHHHHCDDGCEEEGEDKNQNYHEKFFPPSPSTVTTPTSTIASTHTNNDFIFTDDSYEDDNVSNTKDCHSIHNDTTTATEKHGVSVADDTTATPELSSFLVNAINASNNNNNTHNDSLFDDSSDPKEEDITVACNVDNGNKQQVIMKERKEELVSLVKEEANNNDTDKAKEAKAYKDEASSSSSASLLADDDDSYHVSFKPSNALYLQAMEGYTAKAKADIELATTIGIKRINSIGSAMSASSSSSIASTASRITTTMVKEPESNIIDYLRQFDEIATGTTTTEEDSGGTKQGETTGGDKSSTTSREQSSSTHYPSPSLPKTNNNAGGKRIYVCSLLTALSVLIIVILLIPTVMMTMMNDSPSSLDYNHDEDVIMNRARTFFGVLPKDDDNDDGNEECKANSSNTIMPMTGIVVVVSETNSQLGKELKYHFEQLGATVASTDINNCNDLNSVSELIDALLDSHGKIDYLIHTGNMCLFPSPSLLSLSPASIKNYYHNYLNTVQHIGSMVSSSSSAIHGYDMLFTGNYIAAFLMTQKLIPYLERSRFGTVVQFASSLATLDVLDGSSLEIDGSNDSSSPPTASVLLHQKQRSRFVPSFLYLPVQYAYIKLATILSQRAFGRDYPNIRTIEFNNLSWLWMIQDRRRKGINDLFRNLFDTEADASSSSYVSSKLIENENLQEDLYEWSLRAVSKWIATDSSRGGTNENLSTGDWIKKGILFGSENSSSRNVRKNNKKEATSIFEYRLSISETTTAVVTGTTLAWMAIKAKASWQTFTFQ